MRQGLRVGGYALLAYLYVAAVAHHRVTPTRPPAGNGPGAIGTPRVPLCASSTSYGPKSALDGALSEVRQARATRPMNCRVNARPTCAPDAAMASTDIDIWIVAYTATVTANCQCWCK